MTLNVLNQLENNLLVEKVVQSAADKSVRAALLDKLAPGCKRRRNSLTIL